MTATVIHEPTVALPTRQLLVTIGVTAAATAAAWMVIAALAGPADAIGAGAAGAAVVALVSIASMLAIRPWLARPISEWTTMWLAALIGRLLLTPVLAYLLYSATPFAMMPLLLSVAVTYVIVQISEAASLALYLKRVT